MIVILRVVGAFGVNGGVRVSSYSRNLSAYKKVYDKDRKEYSFRVMKFLSNGKAVISLENIHTRTQAESFKGEFFYIKKIDLPSKKENEFYAHDLVGQKAYVVGSRIKCLITNVENFGAGDLMEISHKNKKFLVPFTTENFPNAENEIFIALEAFNGFKE
ncbi:MAG: ribosome maturation factor RimM [Holosporaceae bacterium]|jgi:16S rRNA processing protein RimM|nr:ribosome maturation factor RimM [Holosporaceae bacterium]